MVQYAALTWPGCINNACVRRTPGDGDDIDFYISATQEGEFAGTPPTTGWTVPSYSNPTQIPQGAGAGFATYPAPTLDVDACDGEGEHPQLVLGGRPAQGVHREVVRRRESYSQPLYHNVASGVIFQLASHFLILI